MTATWCGVIGRPISSKVGSSAAAAPAPFNMTAVMAVIENRFFMINLPLRGREPCGKDATMHNVPSQGSPMVRSLRERRCVGALGFSGGLFFKKETHMGNKKLRVLKERAMPGIGVKDERRVRDVLLKDKRVDAR